MYPWYWWHRNGLFSACWSMQGVVVCGNIYIYISLYTAVYHPHSYMEITKLTTHICFIFIYLWILSKCRYLDPWHISLKIRYVSIRRTQIYYFISYLHNINVITDSTRLVEGDRLWLWRYCITGGVEEGGPDHHSTASLAGPRHRKSSTPEDTVKPTKFTMTWFCYILSCD